MKKAVYFALAALLLGCALAGCSARQHSASVQDIAPTPGVRRQELDFRNGDKKICGTMYFPGEEKKQYPAVILSHGFGGAGNDNQLYAEKLAQLGYACYTFDFCGGGRSSKSDGAMTEMSVLTEKADLLAVMDGIKALDYIDTDNLFLFGESQGGFVSSMAAAERASEVKGMVLLYPAYVLQDDCWKRHGSIDNVPQTEVIMGNTIGAVYSTDAMSFDIYDILGGYSGPVYILHGDKDKTVDVSYSERAAKTFPHAELKVLHGTGHGFFARKNEAAELLAPWVLSHTDPADFSSESEAEQ